MTQSRAGLDRRRVPRGSADPALVREGGTPAVCRCSGRRQPTERGCFSARGLCAGTFAGGTFRLTRFDLSHKLARHTWKKGTLASCSICASPLGEGGAEDLGGSPLPMPYPSLLGCEDCAPALRPDFHCSPEVSLCGGWMAVAAHPPPRRGVLSQSCGAPAGEGTAARGPRARRQGSGDWAGRGTHRAPGACSHSTSGRCAGGGGRRERLGSWSPKRLAGLAGERPSRPAPSALHTHLQPPASACVRPGSPGRSAHPGDGPAPGSRALREVLPPHLAALRGRRSALTRSRSVPEGQGQVAAAAAAGARRGPGRGAAARRAAPMPGAGAPSARRPPAPWALRCRGHSPHRGRCTRGSRTG